MWYPLIRPIVKTFFRISHLYRVWNCQSVNCSFWLHGYIVGMLHNWDSNLESSRFSALHESQEVDWQMAQWDSCPCKMRKLGVYFSKGFAQCASLLADLHGIFRAELVIIHVGYILISWCSWTAPTFSFFCILWMDCISSFWVLFIMFIKYTHRLCEANWFRLHKALLCESPCSLS